MDVLITPEASREIQALGIARPSAPGWGFLIGHKRGFRFIVEKVLAAGNSRPGAAARCSREIERLWPGRVIGLFAVRAGPEIKKAVRGPFFYGKLFVELRYSRKGSEIRPFVVEFRRAFRLVPLPLEPLSSGADR